MENRFGLKDLLLYLLMLAVIVLIILAMVQYDRQWQQIQTITGRLDEQAKSLRSIQDLLANGVAVNSQSSNSTTKATAIQDGDPFARIRAATTQPGFARGDWLIDMFPGQVAKLTPLLSGDAYADDVQGQVLESLAQRDPNTLKWTGLLATDSWKMTDNSKAYDDFVAQQKKAGKSDDDIAKDPSAPDAVKIHFTLRDGLRFSDGEPLTADDVVFTYNFIMNPAIACPRYRSDTQRIKRVVKTGPLDVDFVFGEPYYAAFELAASMPILPKHFYEKYKPEDFNQSVGLLLGSGPYRMQDPTSWKPGIPIELVRNERYWGLTPAFDRLQYKEISDDKGRLATFRNGESDVFHPMPAQYHQLINDPSLMSHVHRYEYQNIIGGYRFVAWNETNPLFKDKRVRQALTMLLDRNRMIQEIAYGYGILATGPFNPKSPQCDPNIKPWSYDVEGAKKLLADAGFKLGSDGVLHDAQNRPFSFRLTYPAGSGDYEKMALFMKDAYAKAGIVLAPDALEWGAFTERLDNKNFEAISLGWTAGVESDIFQMFHSSQAVAGGDDFMSYKSPELDTAIEQARRTMDESKRMALWQKAHRILHEDQPYTFLWYPKSLIFLDQRIHNVQLVKLGLNPSSEWFVPRDEQKWTK